MLSRELMGMLCLAVVWSTALLVVAAAVQDLRALLVLRRRARAALRATVESGEPLAQWRVEQRGRALDGKAQAIVFHDRAFHSEILGGRVRIGERTYRVNGPGELWVSPEDRAAAAEAHSIAFDSAYAQSVRAAGYQRDLKVQLRPGNEVFAMGRIEGDALVGEGALILSNFDPVPLLTRQIASVASFIPAELAACSLVTVLALSRPHFGPLSILGAILCLGFFLGVTPIAVALRERVRRPSEAHVRGMWSLRAE